MFWMNIAAEAPVFVQEQPLARPGWRGFMESQLRSIPNEVLQGLMHRAIGHNLVDTVAGPAQRKAEVVRHAQQLSKIDPCIALNCESATEP